MSQYILTKSRKMQNSKKITLTTKWILPQCGQLLLAQLWLNAFWVPDFFFSSKLIIELHYLLLQVFFAHYYFRIRRMSFHINSARLGKRFKSNNGQVSHVGSITIMVEEYLRFFLWISTKVYKCKAKQHFCHKKSNNWITSISKKKYQK